MKRRLTGFTFAELIVVMGILSVITAIGTSGVFSTISRSKTQADREKFIADLASQQMKAVSGTTLSDGTIVDRWGVKIAGDKYILFAGTSFVEGAITNVELNMIEGISLSTDFPNGEIKFVRSSGEVEGLADVSANVTITDNGGAEKILRINRYGKIVNE